MVPQKWRSTMANTVDSITGEVLSEEEYPEPTDLADELMTGSNYLIKKYAFPREQQARMQIHMALAYEKGLTGVSGAREVVSYIGNVPHKFADFIGKKVKVLGAIIYWHPPYLARQSTVGDPSVMPGYYKLLVKLDEMSEQKVISGEKVEKVQYPVVISVSALAVAEVMLTISLTNGWYDWKEPISVVFSG